ncbi:MAG: PBP1A family penicillin-binding protein [Acidobacteria bacterium]|nr:PBP1A family penicillin-binding protein [Acidobacteriota bacterium]
MAQQKAGRARFPLWLRIFFAILVITFLAAGSAFGVLLGYQYNLPPIQSLEDYRPDVITEVYSDDNRVIGELYLERRIIVSHDEIPPYLQLAILATEDDQFYQHSGINYFSIARAVVKDLIRQSYPIGKGASTITQQLARMLISSFEKTYDRKIKEVLIAWKIEKLYSKQQILTLYCNLHPMGHGIYGVAAAADSYFGKELKDLTLEECAMIAGLPSNPTKYSPRLHPKAALSRRNFVIDRMVTERMISPEMAAEAKAKPLNVLRRSPQRMGMAPHFLERVRQSLAERYSTDEIWRKGLQVYTTLNIQMQNAATRALREGLGQYDKRHGWRGPIGNVLEMPDTSIGTYTHPGWRRVFQQGDIVVGVVEGVGNAEAAIRIGRYHGSVGAKEIAWTKADSPGKILKPGDLAYFKIVSIDDEAGTVSILLDQKPKVEGAIIVLQNNTGEIKAMVGGYDFESSEFNRAVQAMRQVGSTFKPIVYASAFEKGMTPETIIDDDPISHTDDLGRIWQPRNYDGKFKGPISIRQSLTESRNIPTVKVASIIGIKNVVVMARRFGIGGQLPPYLPLALGACEATPLEMASAFTVFPNLGIQAEPYFIRKVEDYDRVKKEETFPKIREVLSPEIAKTILGLLQNVVQGEGGTAAAARSLGRPVGGKTGTTDDFTDSWFVGFTPSLTAAVWVGFDEKKTLGSRQSGSVVALPIWVDCMREILKDKPFENFPTVETISRETPLIIEEIHAD